MSSQNAPAAAESCSRERVFKLTMAYDGTNYCGWQRQAGHNSVQAEVERAICKLTGQPSVVARASSRTDSGVHALGQVVSFSSSFWNSPAEHLTFALNSTLPRDIVVRNSQEADPGFHPIIDCIGKRYRYQIFASRIPDPLGKRFRWWTPRMLDLQAMQQAAKLMIGTHDFASFQTRGSPRQSTCRTVRDVQVIGRQHLDGVAVDIEVEADGFLYNMVRNIAGTLMQVGHGRRSPEWIERVLAARDRRAAGQTAPPEGLFLLEVYYPR